MKILIAIDESPVSDAAVNFVIDQLKPEGIELRLFHVLDPYPVKLAKRIGGRDTPDFVTAVQKQKAMATELLEHAAERLSSAGFSVTSSIQEGDVRALILEEAKAWHADLIVIGSHERKGIRHFFSGSISEDVARDAPCSVEVVRVPAWARRVSFGDPEESFGCRLNSQA
jgi:nucleotide-binding universal stress UspA family protein